jgi:glycine cleavage system transcriptional repressor
LVATIGVRHRAHGEKPFIPFRDHGPALKKRLLRENACIIHFVLEGLLLMNKAILSILGRDRPGIVAAVSQALTDQNCNIENVSQTMIQREFAGIFIVTMPTGMTADDLHHEMTSRFSPVGLHVYTKPCETGEDFCAVESCEPFVITTKGPDRKGLVAGISEVIARHGVNITNLQAVFKGGEDPGDNTMIYEVDVPASVNQRALAQDLRDKAESLRLEISIQHRNIFEAIHRI